MPFVAYCPECDDIVFAQQADPKHNHQCVECHADAEHVRSHSRTKRDGGETQVTSHFRYANCPHGSVSDPSENTGGGGGGGGGGGESDLHKRRKRAALQEALDRYPDADYGIEVTIGDKQGDAVLHFDTPHETYGRGLVIEYQHKNEGKDIEAVEQNYAKHEYTTVWLWETEFTFTSAIPDIDLFGGRVYTPWPDAVPESDEWSGRGEAHEMRQNARSEYLTEIRRNLIEATFPRHWTIPTAAEHWRDETNEWMERFRNENEPSTADYRFEAALSGHNNPTVEATIPRHWILPTAAEYWHDDANDWDARFPDEHQTSTADYIAQAAVPRRAPTLRVPMTLPDSVARDEWRSTQWDARFRNECTDTAEDYILEVIENFTVDIDFKSAIERSVTPPENVFDDVQCHECGHYRPASSAPAECVTCGTPYDWVWNIRTNRISRDSVPDEIDF